MLKQYAAIIALVAIGYASAQTMPALPPLPSNLSTVCFSDSAYLPYYQVILDTIKKMDTSGTTKDATVKATCDTLKVVIPLGFFELPVFTMWKMNACSLGMRMFDPSAPGGVRDSVVDVCKALPVHYGLNARTAAGNGAIAVARMSSGSFVIRVDGSESRGAQVVISTASGRTVRTISLGSAGMAAWDGTDASGNASPAGLYVCTGRSATGEMRSTTFIK